MLTFYDWLTPQSRRDDAIGALARHAFKDKLFPRNARHLYLFLLRYEGLPVLRAAVIRAHAEYRRTRKAMSSKAVRA